MIQAKIIQMFIETFYIILLDLNSCYNYLHSCNDFCEVRFFSERTHIDLWIRFFRGTFSPGYDFS